MNSIIDQIIERIENNKESNMCFKIGDYEISIELSRFWLCEEYVGKDYLSVLKELLYNWSNSLDINAALKILCDYYHEEYNKENINSIIDYAVFSVICDYINVRGGMYLEAKSYKEAMIRNETLTELTKCDELNSCYYTVDASIENSPIYKTDNTGSYIYSEQDADWIECNPYFWAELGDNALTISEKEALSRIQK